MSPESSGRAFRGAPVAPAVGALVLLDTAPVVPAHGPRFDHPLDLLTREARDRPGSDCSDPETLSPSRLVVNPKVARLTSRERKPG